MCNRGACAVCWDLCVSSLFSAGKKFHSWCGVTVVVWFHSRNLTALPTFKNYKITNSRCSLCSNINSTQLAPAIPPSAQVFLCCSTRVERDRFREIMCCFCATYFHFSRAFSAFSCVSSARTNKKKEQLSRSFWCFFISRKHIFSWQILLFFQESSLLIQYNIHTS